LRPKNADLDQSAVPQRVAHAGRDVEHPRTARLGPAGRHGEDRRDHHVDRDDVDDPFGDAGELPEETSSVRDDDGFGHTKAADPTRSRLCQCRLDDGGPYKGDGDAPLELLDEGPLAEGLREGIGVGPSE